MKHLSTPMTLDQFDSFITAIANLEDEAVIYTSKSGKTAYCDCYPLFTNSRGVTRVCGEPENDQHYIDYLIEYYSSHFDRDESVQQLIDILKSFK